MAARLGPQAAARRAAHGIADLDTETALRALDSLLRDPAVVQAIVAPVARTMRGDEKSVQSDALLGIREAAPNRRRALLTNYTAAQLAVALGLGDGSTIGPDQRFMDMGMDSLIAIELRNRLQADLGTPLAQSVILDYPTLRTLAAHLEVRLFGGQEKVEEKEEVEEAEADLDDIAILADSEIRKLLTGRP